MNVTTYPKAYQSAFREALFVLGDVAAPAGVDVAVVSAARPMEPPGVKRIYATGSAAVNVAPYVRSLLDIRPLCGSDAGPVVDISRTAPCGIVAQGVPSAVVHLTGGTLDAPTDRILSGQPDGVKIARGERDEVSVFTTGVVKGEFICTNDGVTYGNSQMREIASSGMITMVVDPDVVWQMLESLPGADPARCEGFTFRLKIMEGGRERKVLERRYTMEHYPAGGRRLAWVNRYGAVDYYTFPDVKSVGRSGGRTPLNTPTGSRTLATRALTSEVLVSDPCDEGMADWLAEVFSSPAVWIVRGREHERVDVSEGEVVSMPARPCFVSVTIASAAKIPSRKL